ncbi:hypothetical protein [Allocoleopsis sp.]|uniref:hypothetical protein n=1 Tax=Allocoleopsis sp. TaxID=3088169 RepID=UPI002FD7476C
MESTNVSTSSLHKAIAALAEYLEDKFSPDLFGFLDGGTTLEIMSEALLRVSCADEWQRLLQQYQQVGGTIYCPDDNEWEVV